MIVGIGLGYLGFNQIDKAVKGWNDPVKVDLYSRDPFIGQIFEARYREMVSEETHRRWNDRYQATGETWKNSPYPWTSYRATEGSNSFGLGDYFEATESIINQDFGRLTRWSNYSAGVGDVFRKPIARYGFDYWKKDKDRWRKW